MKRGRLPLTALRSFEAAGRHLSFTSAAEELCISQAAVSRQIRELERILGHAVFERLHRQVVLTPAGDALLTVLTRSFDDIDDALKTAFAREQSASLRISVEPSFAGRWLVPHLAGFQQFHPEVDIVLDSDPRLIDFRRDQPQLAIRHSEEMAGWPRSESQALFDVHMIAVIAPQLAANSAPIDRPEDILRHVLRRQGSVASRPLAGRSIPMAHWCSRQQSRARGSASWMKSSHATTCWQAGFGGCSNARLHMDVTTL
jgi:LysR family glycine cleavage system transcriptional activator